MAKHRHVAIEEPADQGRPFAVRQAVGIVGHRVQHVAPIGYRAAHIAQYRQQVLLERTAFLGIHTVSFEIDKGLAGVCGLPLSADGFQDTSVIAHSAQNRVD